MASVEAGVAWTAKCPAHDDVVGGVVRRQGRSGNGPKALERTIARIKKELSRLSDKQWAEGIVPLIRLRRYTLERKIGDKWDATLSLRIDQLLALEEALSASTTPCGEQEDFERIGKGVPSVMAQLRQGEP